MKKLLFLLSALIFILLIFSACSSKDETQKCKLIVTSSNETLGTVTGGGIYENGTIVTIEAIEKEYEEAFKIEENRQANGNYMNH